MSKEWILNAATARFQLNFKRNVGAVAEEIRRCEPRTLDDWQNYYFAQVYPESHLRDLGQRLFVKISEVLRAELEEVSEEDCIRYIRQLVIERTFAGYQTEKATVYEQLQRLIETPIQPARDALDRLFNVDFTVAVGPHLIGLQIKPATFYHAHEYHKWREVQAATHRKFQHQFGGAVFTVVSIKQGDAKIIANPEVVEEIRAEIERLKIID